MSKPLQKLVFKTSDRTQYSELMAGFLVGIVKRGCAPFIDHASPMNLTFDALEKRGCLVVWWEDRIPFDVTITKYGKRTAKELEAQGVSSFFVATHI